MIVDGEATRRPEQCPPMVGTIDGVFEKAKKTPVKDYTPVCGCRHAEEAIFTGL